MYWLKRDIWKVGIALAGLLLFVVLTVWIPASSVGASESASETAVPVTGTVQTTATEDATMAALNKQKLERDNDRSFQAWFWSSGATILSTLALVVGGVIGFWRWRVDRQDTQDKDRVARQDAQDKDRVARQDAQDKDLRDKAEERFKTAVAALGDENEVVQVGGAILLRSFLNKGDNKIYGRYYTQIFDLAVAYLRLSNISHSLEDPDGLSPSPKSLTAPPRLTPLRQALIVVVKEVFPLARQRLTVDGKFDSHLLDASTVLLDGASLDYFDLCNIYMRKASLTKVHLDGAYLADALLMKADFSEADLWGVHLEGASLHNAIFTKATLIKAALINANLTDANLTSADLYGANLSDANLTGTILQGAKYNTKTIRMRVVNEYLVIIDPQGTIIVEPTIWPQGVKLDGAIDVTDSPPQSPVSPSPSLQGTNEQTPSVPSVAANTPPQSTNGSSATSPKPDSES